MAESTATALRQQYRSKLEAGLTQGRQLLDRYQQAYPDLSQIDWPGVQGYLATQPVGGANIHAAPEGLRPSWIQEQTIEPVEFGSLADPVSQLAFWAAPGMLRAGKATLETIGSPGPRGFTAFAGERGSLGPVSRGQQREAVVGERPRLSVVRHDKLLNEVEVLPGGEVQLHLSGGSRGELQRLVSDQVAEHFRPSLPEGTWWRFTRNPEEPALMEQGVLRTSRNVVDDMPEAGLSVSRHPGYAMQYPYGYKVTGKQVGVGSDGEPLLDIASVRPASGMQTAQEIHAEYNAALNDQLAQAGWPRERYDQWTSGVFDFP